jgi:hypothetical protein
MHQAERISGHVTCPRMGDASTDCTIGWNASASMLAQPVSVCSAVHSRATPTIGAAKDRRQRRKMTWPTPQCSPHQSSKLCACELVHAVSEECMSERCEVLPRGVGWKQMGLVTSLWTQRTWWRWGRVGPSVTPRKVERHVFTRWRGEGRECRGQQAHGDNRCQHHHRCTRVGIDRARYWVPSLNFVPPTSTFGGCADPELGPYTRWPTAQGAAEGRMRSTLS